jgi:hypothetical protein
MEKRKKGIRGSGSTAENVHDFRGFGRATPPQAPARPPEGDETKCETPLSYVVPKTKRAFLLGSE